MFSPCVFVCLFVCVCVCVVVYVYHDACPDDLTMKDWCHTNNILQVHCWGCLVVQVIFHALMTSLVTSQDHKIGQILKLIYLRQYLNYSIDQKLKMSVMFLIQAWVLLKWKFTQVHIWLNVDFPCLIFTIIWSESRDLLYSWTFVKKKYHKIEIFSWVDFHLSKTQAWVRNSTRPLVSHKQYFAGTLLGMSSCASYVSRTHDVIDDVTRSQSRSNFEINTSPSIFELQRRSKAQNVRNAHGYLSVIFNFRYNFR